jgi:hypothetical protein
MNNTELTNFAAIAQIVLPIVTLVGIVISMWLSVKALREVQIDRKLRQMPHLAFEIGGSTYKIEFSKAGTAVGGIDPKYAQKVFKDIPRDAESISLKTGKGGEIIQEYGKLKNYGTGPALSTEVVWIPQKVKVGAEVFEITKEKMLEPHYSRELNCIPASPSHILPGEVASFFRLPTFIQKDFEKKIKEIKGFLKIRCEDIFNGVHTEYQEFFLFTDYNSDNPNIHFTFGDVLKVSLL